MYIIVTKKLLLVHLKKQELGSAQLYYCLFNLYFRVCLHTVIIITVFWYFIQWTFVL